MFCLREVKVRRDEFYETQDAALAAAHGRMPQRKK